MPGLDPGIWFRFGEIAGSSPAMTMHLRSMLYRHAPS
jgi:hypothetical protein